MKNYRQNRRSSRCCLDLLPAALLAAVTGFPVAASAFEIDTGNPDVVMSWNNTVRYTYLRRMQEIDPHVAFAGAPFAQAGSDYSVKKGGSISNRIEDLTELNFAYQERYGFRITAALWYDHAFKDKKPQVLPGTSSFVTPYNGEFPNAVKRYYEGPSGEFLDTYVFGNFNTDVADVNVRVGRHANIWGEGLIGSTHSIAYSQAPSDGRKATVSPGASAKETALPINQASFSAVFDSEFTLLGYYQFEWRPTRVPEGGTYFAPADSVFLTAPINNRAEAKKGESGAYGIGVKWSPQWLDGTLGFYYREFDDMQPGWPANTAVGFPAGTTQAVYAKGIKLYGVSLAKTIASVSVAAEVSYRKDGPLVSTGVDVVNGIPEGARGDTWHAVLNGIKLFGQSPLWGSASLTGELAYSNLDKVTKNVSRFRSRHNPLPSPGASGVVGTCFTPSLAAPTGGDANMRGCADDEFYQATVVFTPTWPQALPGVDISAPLLFQKNYGNAPSAGGGNDGFVTYKVGLSALAWAKHQFDLSYTWWDQHIDRAMPGTPGAAGSTSYGRILGAPYSDKGFLAFTYQTTF